MAASKICIYGEITRITSSDPLERIGYGSCGTVWADPSDAIDSRSSAVVIKRGDGLPDRSISNECEIHRRILQSTSRYLGLHKAGGFQINIPRHIDFLPPTSPSWPQILPRMPEGFTSCEALISERVMPLPKPARHALLEKFWAGDAEPVLNDKRNEHCLIRPYLGRRRAAAGARRSMFKSISLRNYPLYVDQLEKLGLPTAEYATAMADALALLLWVVNIDACDVEFVLGRQRTPAVGVPVAEPQACIGTQEYTFGALGPHALWILDFDCCRDLSLDTEGINMAAERFWRNDPFYPNPDYKCPADQHLWEQFRDRFLETSGLILRDKGQHEQSLPGLLVARIVETIGMYNKGVFR